MNANVSRPMDTADAENTEVESHLKENMLLRFRVGPFRFCVPAVEVEGIIIPPELTVIPLNPAHSKGVFMHHGRITSAISLRSKFGLPDHDDKNMGQLILGDISAGMVGFWVDEVYETVDSTELEWRSMPDFIPHDAFESFAVKGDDVIMATNMQKLYDVPAEQMASMLAGLRENFDLPEDMPPVATESFDVSVSGDADDDSFGDLAGLSSAGDQETGAEVSLPEANEAGEEEARPATGSVSASARPGSESKTTVVDLGARRSQATTGTQATGSARSTHHSATSAFTNKPGAGKKPVRPLNYAAARNAANRNVNPGVRPAAGASRTAPNSGHRAETSGQRFAGGTYAGSVNRMQSQYSQTASESVAARSYDEDKRQSGSAKWWLLALALLLLAMLVIWFWPSKREQGTISTIPSQNYNQRYSFQDKPASEPESQPQAAVTPPPAIEPESSPPDTTPVEPVSAEAAVPENTSAESETAVETRSGEIYRLEGEEVTVTVERNPVATEAMSPVEPEQVTPAYTEFVHVVVKGDTLWDIAAKYLKNPFRYPELAQLSRIDNPDLIYPGDTVRIRKKN